MFFVFFGICVDSCYLILLVPFLHAFLEDGFSGVKANSFNGDAAIVNGL